MSGTEPGHPFAAMLSLTDLEKGAEMQASYDDYATLVARELSEGMTRDQQQAASQFLSKVSTALHVHSFHRPRP